MKQLTFEDVMLLIAGDRIIHIRHDHHESLICVGPHPKIQGMVFIKLHRHTEAVVLTETSFGYSYAKFFSGVYDTASVGKIMLQHLQERIDSVNETYLKT